MSRRLLLQSILKFREGIKSGAAKVQDIVEDYFKSSGKSVTDEDRAIIMNEFAESAPSNVTTLEGVDPRETIMPMGGVKTSYKPVSDKINYPEMEKFLGVKLRGNESFDELLEIEKTVKESRQGLGSLFPKGKPGEIFDVDNSKREEVAEFIRKMRGAGIKNKDIKGVFKESGTDIAQGKRAATTLARAADMKADTKIKQEFLSELDEKIADKGPRFFNEEYQGFDSYGALINNEGKRIRNAIYDDLEEMGVDEDTISRIIRSANEVAERRPYEPEAFMASIKDDLEINEINYNTDFWDNYISKTLELSIKPEPRFEYGGMV